MAQQLYSYSLFAAWILLFFFGGSLLFGRVPEKVSSGYARARKILGVAFYCFAFQIFIQWKFEFRQWNPSVATALNFSCFYLEAFLFGMSFISLLDGKYICRRRVILDLFKYVVLMVFVWTAAIVMNGMMAKIMMWIVAIWFCVDSAHIAIVFFRTYHKVVKEVDNYYVDDVMAFVRWLYKSTYGIVIFGLSCTIMAFAPIWAIGIYMSSGILMFVYIYTSFQNYMMYYGEVSNAIEDASAMEKELQEAGGEKGMVDIADSKRTDSILEIGEHLHQWKMKKKYLCSGITIESLAKELNTNRVYLSMIVNREGRHTFREWITSLRMEDAKRMLTDNKNMTIAEVAYKCGFSSDSYFVRVFSVSEGMTPAKWRERHAEHIR